MPELVVGVLVMTVFALGAVLWHLSAVDKSPALAVIGTVERGQTLSSSDVRVVYVASDDRLAHLTQADMNSVVGQVALVDLAPGTPAHALGRRRPSCARGGRRHRRTVARTGRLPSDGTVAR
ncbi:MAG: hypothetical protein M5T61_16720 [Acidimicrobiia bacterium]|nr:hypothetical protein [Acidimicrobiia bacterium]